MDDIILELNKYYIIGNTNQSLVYLIDVVQIIVLLILCGLFIFRKKQNTVFMQVYSLMLAYLCGMTGIKLMFDLSAHTDDWYKPYITSSLMLVPIIEGLMFSLYRQGISFWKVMRRITFNESPFFIITIMTLTIGYHSWYKTVAYSYLAVFAVVAFVITLVRIKLFSRQVRQAYSDADERGLMWIRPILVIAAVLIMTFAVSLVFVFAWVRIAFDAVSVFVYAGVGFYLMRQKPVDNTLVDNTRMFLQGDMVDKVQVRVLDSKGEFTFVNIDEKLTREKMIDLGKQLDKFMTTSVDCLKHDFTIAELAEKMGVDSIFLSCYITNELEMDFYTYVNDFRLDYATNILATSPELSIDEVSEKAGFAKVENFLTLFEQRYMCSPNLFREQGVCTFDEIVRPLQKIFIEKRPHFIAKMKEIESSLTSFDLGICMSMALGYSNVRAAVFFGISVNALEIAQCRLRSKLGLLHTDSLETFVQRV